LKSTPEVHMSTPGTRSFDRTAAKPHWAWLLWLALLLPLAQGVANGHVLSHVNGDTSAANANFGAAGGKHALHQTVCDLCLTAAAIGGAAPFDAPPPLPYVAASHTTPLAQSTGVWQALLARAYLSRAPPTSTL
jgi:hypothetical protein